MAGVWLHTSGSYMVPAASQAIASSEEQRRYPFATEAKVAPDVNGPVTCPGCCNEEVGLTNPAACRNGRARLQPGADLLQRARVLAGANPCTIDQHIEDCITCARLAKAA